MCVSIPKQVTIDGKLVEASIDLHRSGSWSLDYEDDGFMNRAIILTKSDYEKGNYLSHNLIEVEIDNVSFKGEVLSGYKIEE